MDMSDKLRYLAEINLFKELPAADLEAIDALVPSVTVPTGTILYEPGQPLDRLYFLKRGRVRLYALSASGRELSLAMLGPGNIFGETDSVATGAGSCFAETVEPALLCTMGTSAFRHLMAERPTLAIRLVEMLSERIHSLQELTATMVFQDVKTRVAQLLLKLAHQFGDDKAGSLTKIPFVITHQEIAAMVGSTRESVSVAMGDLSADHLILTGRGHVEVNCPRVSQWLAETAG